MNQYPIIRSSEDARGSRLEIVLEDGNFICLLREAAEEENFRVPCSSLADALATFLIKARDHDLKVQVETLMLPVGELICVQSEYRGQAREVVRIFSTQEDFDLFRRERLASYNDECDREDVAGLLESGNLDAAWNMAVDDDADVKCAWDTHFGSHYVFRQPNFAPFSQLPTWLQSEVVATLTS